MADDNPDTGVRATKTWILFLRLPFVCKISIESGIPDMIAKLVPTAFGTKAINGFCSHFPPATLQVGDL